VALLNSPFLLPENLRQHGVPLSLLYLAASLEQAGFASRIYHLNRVLEHRGAYFWTYDLPDLLRNLESFGPQLIGITCPYSARWCFVRRLAAILRQRLAVPLVLGGIHPTSFPEYCLAESEADYVVLGEGEETLAALASCLAQGRAPTAIDGLAWKAAGGGLNPKTRYIENLDALPFPAYHLLDMERQRRESSEDRFFQFKGHYFSIITSRSCPNQCAFCNMYLSHGKRWRSRSPENVLAEIRFLAETYQARQFAVMDDNFTFNRDRAVRILQGIVDLGLDLRLSFANGLSAKTLDDELIGLLKKAGACELYISIESGSEHIRNRVYEKRLPEAKILEVYDACRRHRLPVSVNFMIGAPDESDETIAASLAMMKRVRAPAYFNFTTPFKGTKLYAHYEERGLIDERVFQEGMAIDLRSPFPGLHDPAKLLAWRRKLRLWNLVYAWREILATPGLFSWNTILRWFQTVLGARRVTPDHYREVMDRWMPLDDTATR
jgi:magnesium-protoporphyrin IX monomethyl ester (oxidative) cyclase